MNRAVLKLLFFITLILFSYKPVSAFDPNATESSAVSATVISSSIGSVILIAPKDNSVTNNPREPLVWKRPSPLPATPLHHYDVYLDGVIFAAGISDSITSQSYYSYTISRSGDTFTLNFNTDLAQGYHTWRVVDYVTTGINASTGTWVYYIDSIAPYITLQKVDHQTLNWSTSDINTIPDVNLRDLTVTTPNPLLIGLVEPYSNLQIILLCPQNILNCQNQTWQGNYPTGTWQHRFYGLIGGIVYTVYISATDAAGNSTIFPEFFLAYGVVTPAPKATVTPVASPTPEIGLTPTPEIAVPPVPFIPVPPVSPTPPVFLTTTPVSPQQIAQYWLIILFVLGLPLHLFMTIYGAKISLSHVFKFLLVLFFPYSRKKEFQTTPFSTLEMYDPEDLNSSWQTKISDVNGFYELTSPLLNKIFVKIFSTGHHWKNTIINGIILPNICLIPLLDDPKTTPDRLRTRSMRLRSIPLVLACLTSAVALFIKPNYFFLIYLYLSVHLVFAEYLYPKLTK